jgi:hypothetical protein
MRIRPFIGGSEGLGARNGADYTQDARNGADIMSWNDYILKLEYDLRV